MGGHWLTLECEMTLVPRRSLQRVIVLRAWRSVTASYLAVWTHPLPQQPGVLRVYCTDAIIVILFADTGSAVKPPNRRLYALPSAPDVRRERRVTQTPPGKHGLQWYIVHNVLI